MEKGYFHSEPDDREPFTVVIPPPNVTGVLHMGHMLNNTIQDILIRKARLEGKNACWVPGTDHASIATEAKVVRWLREEMNLTKGELSRDEFMKYAWQWKEKYGGIILDQLKRLGASCDWEREAFTMDEVRSDAVIKAFVDLYKKGKLYRDHRMVNWDPEAQTVLSNEEVLYSNEQSKLYHVNYPIEGSDQYITIATTRPETILADTALAVHPDDERYVRLKGKKVKVPLTDRVVPIIFDDYVDQEFGTGALKITPAHDPNDYEIGKKHGLEVIEILDDRGRMNETAGMFVGEDRMKARKLMGKALEDAGFLKEIEDYTNNVGRSERTNAVVEPKLSLQWYVDMKALAAPALEAVMSDEVEFVPKSQKNLYRHWMENIRDWCISRQLWWGHRIPAYYIEDQVFVAETADQALEQARAAFPEREIQASDLRQDEDVLDTWFSSWLWPISVFDGFKNREELDYYYPTSVLVTGWDIIFLWVARMVMAGYEWEEKRPFEKVYFTGMVRDKQRRKMSKSLGNSPDALGLIDDFGADSVRFGMLSSSPAGGDLLFDEKLIEQGRNFCNKMWNALRLIKGWEVDAQQGASEANLKAIHWMRSRKQEIVNELEQSFGQFRLSEGLMQLYNFIWNDFCSWYLELIKPAYGAPIDRETLEETIEIFEELMVMLHPFMPFISEEIWHQLNERGEGADCIVATYPSSGSFDEDLNHNMEEVRTIVTKVREIRSSKGLSPKESLELMCSNGQHWLLDSDLMGTLVKMANLSEVKTSAESPEQAISFVVGTDKFFVPIGDMIDVEEEIKKLEKDLEYAQGFVASVEKKLSNERFVQNAPEQVVAKERQKLSDGQERMEKIRQSLENLKKS
jgi:valyl-tRNA synthetase